MSNSLLYRDLLSSKGLRITPQRMRVLESVFKLDNHPTAENILDYIKKEILISVPGLYIKFWKRSLKII
jgi:Fe2+/Zn2+ uptake regulation proteins